MSRKSRLSNTIPSGDFNGLLLTPTPSSDPNLSTDFVSLPAPLEVKVKKSIATNLGVDSGAIVLITRSTPDGESLSCASEIVIDENLPHGTVALSLPVRMSLNYPTDKVRVEVVSRETIKVADEVTLAPPKKFEDDVPAAVSKLLNLTLENKIVTLNSYIPLLYRGEIDYFKISSSSVPTTEKCILIQPEKTIVTIIPDIASLTSNFASISLSATSKKSTTGFNRVGGLGHVLDELSALVRAPLERPELYKAMGVKPPKGVLLFGPPGTGKTLLAKALAEELSCGFEFADAVTLVSRVPGETEERVSRMFQRARETANEKGACILFVDEIDAVCAKREEASSDAERRIVTAFLTALDGISGKGDNINEAPVILLGATNRPNALDEAVRRAGRLEAELEVGVPSRDGRHEILMILLNSIPSALTEKEVNVLADKTHAFTGADLARLVSTAAKGALMEELANNPFKDQMKEIRKLAEESDSEGDSSEDEDEQQERRERNRSRQIARDRLNAKKEEEDTTPLVLPKVLFTHFEKGLIEVRPSALKELAVEVPSVKWSDIGGYAETKQRLQEMVEWPLKYSNLFKQVGVDAPKGVLLYGPPGTGKTLLARAVATESEMNFIAVKGPELFSKWVGESERAVRDLFRRARQSSPCVIFFDEVDALGVDRETSGDGGGGVGARVLSQMLNEMDGIGPAKQLVVIGATNRPDLLDAALMRPGRFDRLLLVPLPDRIARFEVALNYLKKIPVDETSFVSDSDSQDEEGQSLLSEAVNEFVLSAARWISKRSEGYSGAELVNVCKEAAMDAMRTAIILQHETAKKSGEAVPPVSVDVKISKSHFEKSFDRVKPRIKPSLIEFYNKFESTHTRG